MTILYIILGILLAAIFFLNIKNAADLIARIIGGMGVLILYNTIFTSHAAGINLITAAVVGLLGLPGGVLVLCLGFLF